jgi:tripartite motif-containing protein 71
MRDAGGLGWPGGLCFGRRNQLWICDYDHHRVVVVNVKTKRLVRVIGSEGGGKAEFRGDPSPTRRELTRAGPADVAALPDGAMAVSDSGNHRIQIFNADGMYVREFGSEGSGEGQFNTPLGMAATSNELFVADHYNDRVVVCDLRGNHVRTLGRTGSAPGEFKNPLAVAMDAKGQLWVSDYEGHRIQAFDREGRVVLTAGSKGGEHGQLINPRGLAVWDSSVVVCDAGNHRLSVFDANKGGAVTTFGTNGKGPHEFLLPGCVRIVGKRMFVSEHEGNRVQVFKILPK